MVRKKPPGKNASKSPNELFKRKAFLAAFVECGIVRRAAAMSGFEKTQHYRWLKIDPVYAAEFEEACKQAADNMEDEAIRRARDGLLKLKFHQGQPIIDPRTLPGKENFDPKFPDGQPYFEHEYSDSLLIFLLKGAKPEKYRENFDLTSGNKPLPGQAPERVFDHAAFAATVRTLLGGRGNKPELPAIAATDGPAK